jgi:hypothetical protein
MFIGVSVHGVVGVYIALCNSKKSGVHMSIKQRKEYLKSERRNNFQER